MVLVTKHHARQLFNIGLQNSSAVLLISLTIPSTATNNKIIDVVSRMIKTDRHVTYHDIRTSLGIGMSQIQSILHKYLGMKKLCSRWIPHNLTEARKRTAAFGSMPCSSDSRKRPQI
ncbi:hypothetical protein EVAR_62873_1 [Eumeta japonica]|uniref:Histone-lysine N-methyltransferase SETMAR n=1 Tax=Eumeta variegata TaxID=151549 RepID=A0A4C1Z5R6_EUMVA|nr:hypothetical protein EVAR_62873_1 [Eumeta japonica]